MAANEHRLLLVTFPVDLGNRTLERLLVDLFETRLDLRTHRFAAEQSETFDTQAIDYRKSQRDRVRGAPSLWQAIARAQYERRVVLFHNISPALFGHPALIRKPYFIATDWTRKLYEPMVGKPLSHPVLTALHRRVLRSASKVLAFTPAVVDSLVKDYGVVPAKVAKVKIPFDIDRFRPIDRDTQGALKVLFVGGDLKRKGGDRLLEWYRARADDRVELTVMSNAAFDETGVHVERGVRYGQDRHLRIFQDHDVLVCPTLYDGYPQVIAEAAASGLVVITTKFALGAPDIVEEGVNGFICDSQAEVFERVEALATSPTSVALMKRNSRALMEQRFSTDAIFQDFARHLFERHGDV